MLNIGGDTGDAFYRYKMPKLQTKVEGRGNGIKTNVVNNVDIAKALERPPEYIIKYFGCELGAQTKFDPSTSTSIVNGAHDSAKLAELLEVFIKKYVQCYSCGNPETVVKVKKEVITLKCKACGYVSDVDPRHKLNTFIIKNPPDNKLSKEEKRLKKQEAERLQGAAEIDKKDKKEKKDKKDKDKKDKDKKDKKKKKDDEDGENAENGSKDGDGEGADANGAEEEEEDDDVVWLTDTSEAAIKKRAEEQLTAATAAMVTQGNIEAELEAAKRRAEKAAEKAARKEAEAAAKRAEELAKKAESITLDDIPEDKLDVAAATELLQVCLKGLSAADTMKAYRKLSVEGGPVAKAKALVGAVLGGSSESLVATMKANKAVLTPKDAAAQLALLIAVEQFVGVEQPEKVKELPHALKFMYEEDLADEEVIVAWFGKKEAGKILQVPAEAAKVVRQYAAPVVEWLQNAEDDEDEDEEDEDEDEE